ncbi:hypothetical protein M427DRAFT_53533, partial [Gonapodya prolifera JEL478]
MNSVRVNRVRSLSHAANSPRSALDSHYIDVSTPSPQSATSSAALAPKLPSRRALESVLKIAERNSFDIPIPPPSDLSGTDPNLPGELVTLMREYLKVQAKDIELSTILEQSKDLLSTWDVASAEETERRTYLLSSLSRHLDLASSNAPALVAKLQKAAGESWGSDDSKLLLEPKSQSTMLLLFAHLLRQRTASRTADVRWAAKAYSGNRTASEEAGEIGGAGFVMPPATALVESLEELVKALGNFRESVARIDEGV